MPSSSLPHILNKKKNRMCLDTTAHSGGLQKMETRSSFHFLIFYDLALLLPNKLASTMSISPRRPSGMTSSETPFHKVRYYERLQIVVARLYDTSHELCDIILAAQEHAQLLAFC